MERTAFDDTQKDVVIEINPKPAMYFQHRQSKHVHFCLCMATSVTDVFQKMHATVQAIEIMLPEQHAHQAVY